MLSVKFIFDFAFSIFVTENVNIRRKRESKWLLRQNLNYLQYYHMFRMNTISIIVGFNITFFGNTGIF